MTLRYRLALLSLTAAWVAALVVAGIEVAIPRPPPAALQPVAPAHAPLTRHLALIIVDALRYDISTDPAVMPGFAEAMRTQASAEIWAGAVTMTTGALLAYMAGQYGDLDQIVFNETARRTHFDHFLGRAKERGMVTAATGDGGWFRLFGDVWDLAQPDPPGVSIETDYNDEIFDAALSFVSSSPRPNIFVAHFVTPDHQGHVHTTVTPAYHAHMREFDRKLTALLKALPADWTVFVTSDHGATDTGTHGSDTPQQRRCPIYAYGPGIRAGQLPGAELRQTDLAATFAHLLALPSPAHSTGHVLAHWLDLPSAEQAQVACAELARIQRLAAITTGSNELSAGIFAEACGQGSPDQRLARSHAASRRLAAHIEAAKPAGSDNMWLMLSCAGAGALLLALLWLGRTPLGRLRAWVPSLLVAVVLLGIALVVIRENEKLPGDWPDWIRIPMMVAVNTALLLATIFAKPFARWLDRHAPVVATALVGGLVVSYSAYTQAQAYIFSALTVVMLLVPFLRRHLAPNAASEAQLPLYRVLLAIGLMAAIYPMGFTKRGLLPDELVHSPLLLRWMVMIGIVLFAAERVARRRHEIQSWASRALVLGLLALAVWAPWLHWSASPGQAVALWLLPPLVGTGLWLSGKRTAGELLWLTSYAMVARDGEYLFLLPTLFIAEAVGETMGKMARSAGPQVRHAAVVGIVAFLFAFTYSQRIGIQLGLDFTELDWTAGTFGDQGVSLLRIGTAITFKHVLARASLVLLVLIALPVAYRWRVAYGLLVVELGRTVALMAMLLYCRGSFWTSLRVMSDLPHSLMGVMVAAGACAIALGRSTKRRRAPVAALPAPSG